MASDEWATMPLDEAVQINPRVLLERGEVYPFVDMKAVDPASRSVGPSEMREFKGGGSRFMNGDTLMARITPCLENGKIARFAAPDNQPMGHGSTEFIVIRGKPDVTDNDFAYYLTRWDGVRQYAISQMTGSSGRQRVPTNALTHLEVDLPPLPEQRAIACILGTLDDKIELNRKMNETLEAMARAIFKSWFVDFDPVVYKAVQAGNPIPEKFAARATRYGRPAGRPDDALGLPEDILRLFPDRFVDSELGPIPEGWEVTTISAEFDLTMGQSPPGSTYNERGEGLPFFQGRRDFGFRYPSKRVYCTAPTRIANAGDTLVSVRAPVGDINLAYETCCIGRGVAAIRHKSGSRSYTYYAIRGLEELFKSYESEGTVFGAITKKQLENLQHLAPKLQLIILFEKLVHPMDEMILKLEEESFDLANIRDTLLPKLISGELRVPDAERIVGRCV